MKYPKINLITFILLILGLHPIHEEKRPKWYLKIHLFGFICCVNQVILTAYTFSLEQTRDAFYSSFANNIMHGTVVTKKMFAVGLPIVAIILKFCTFRPLEQFNIKLRILDDFLNAPERRSEIGFDSFKDATEQKIRRMDIFSGVGVLLTEFLNLVTALSYWIFGRKMDGKIPWFTFYVYQSMITLHVAIAINIFNKFYGLTLRQELFGAFVQKVSDLKWPLMGEQRENRRGRKAPVWSGRL